jgi:hypothetical protein
VAGAGSHQTAGDDALRVRFPFEGLSEVGGVQCRCACPYFENCIVDASIFSSNFLVVFVTSY